MLRFIGNVLLILMWIVVVIEMIICTGSVISEIRCLKQKIKDPEEETEEKEEKEEDVEDDLPDFLK